MFPVSISVRPVRGVPLHRPSLGNGGINAVRRVSCLASVRLRFGLPRRRDADTEPSQEELKSILQNEALVRLADEHERVERWWTQASRPILCQYIADPTLFGDELLYLLHNNNNNNNDDDDDDDDDD